MLSGNAFSATWRYQATELALWRLDRDSGELSRIRRITPPADFRAFYGAATLEQFATNKALDSTTLLDCIAALTQCAIRRAPEAYAIRDLSDGRDRGLKLIDPTAGLVVRKIGDKLSLEPWNLRTSEAIHGAATAAKRESVRRIFEAALRVIHEAVSKTGALPTERTATMIDSASAAGQDGLMPEYFVEAGASSARKSPTPMSRPRSSGGYRRLLRSRMECRSRSPANRSVQKPRTGILGASSRHGQRLSIPS